MQLQNKSSYNRHGKEGNSLSYVILEKSAKIKSKIKLTLMFKTSDCRLRSIGNLIGGVLAQQQSQHIVRC